MSLILLINAPLNSLLSNKKTAHFIRLNIYDDQKFWRKRLAWNSVQLHPLLMRRINVLVFRIELLAELWGSNEGLVIQCTTLSSDIRKPLQDSQLKSLLMNRRTPHWSLRHFDSDQILHRYRPDVQKVIPMENESCTINRRSTGKECCKSHEILP